MCLFLKTLKKLQMFSTEDKTMFYMRFQSLERLTWKLWIKQICPFKMLKKIIRKNRNKNSYILKRKLHHNHRTSTEYLRGTENILEV